MRIDTIRVSGFRCLPFCAEYQEASTKACPYQITWYPEACELSLPTSKDMITAIIGPNSSGKSSILYAIDYFFGSATKLKSSCFHQQDETQPVIVEISFKGSVSGPDEWHERNCVKHGDLYELTVASIWKDGRTNLIRDSNGEYRKVGAADRRHCDQLFPEYRLIPADSRLSDDANPDKKNLLADLVNELLSRSQSASDGSVVHEIAKLVARLQQLVDRSKTPEGFNWEEIEALERSLSKGISSLTPSSPQVRFNVSGAMPTLDQIFLKGRVQIKDGVELAFEEHGLGLQRSFVVSTLNVWCEYVGAKQDQQDFVFGFEEPEIFLHPHATRFLLGVLREIGQHDQVIFTSHSPEFVNQVSLDNVINIRRSGIQRRLVRPDLSSLKPREKTKVQRYLREERSDMLFARAVLLVEGQGEMFAIPAFADSIGCQLDKHGVSVVFVNGKGNFETYHHILGAFSIPHVILMDGDGNPTATEKKYQSLANAVYVLNEDFEHLLISVLDEKRLLEVVNECRRRRGRPALNDLPPAAPSPTSLKSQWWKDLKSSLYQDIAPDHRTAYEHQKQELESILGRVAESVVEAGHTEPASSARRRALVLKREGKPMVGRVVGDMLSCEEVEKMEAVAAAIKRTVELAQAGLTDL